MYRRPKFLEELLEIREQMSRNSFYDADLFAENVRNGNFGGSTSKPDPDASESTAKSSEETGKKTRRA
ncbi:MAG: hypothetical protein HKN33_09985 [Pyrinomonadaceae bacterium]|nr:hypothetical protein [Pyrinomonadaceae bacterium]